MLAVNYSTNAVQGSVSRRLIIVGSVTIAAGLLGQFASAAEVEGELDEALKEEILDAMQRRAEAAKSFVYEWTQSSSPIDEAALRTRIDIAFNSQDAEEAEMARRSALAIIALHLGGTYRLVVNDAKMRFENYAQQPVRTDPRILVSHESIAVFHGKVCRDVVLKSSGGYPEAYVSSENHTGGFDVPESLPIAIAFNGRTRFAGYKAIATHAKLDEHPVVVLRMDPPKPRRIGYTFWCDPEKDYHAIRIETRFDSLRSTTYEISYERDIRSDQLVPVRWEQTSWARDGSRFQTQTNKVAHYEVDTEIPPEEFEVEFPTGTYVHDMAKNEAYILLDGGARRVVTEAEKQAGLTYVEIMNSVQQPSKDEQR